MHSILIVEDDLDLRTTIGMSLELEGYQCFLAGNAEDAIAAFTAQLPDLLILDYNLPKMNGGDLCLKVRQLNSSVPVLMLSGDREIVLRAQKVGADLVLKKPFDIDELLNHVGRLTQSKSA